MLIECPECKKTISSEAGFCPHCGYPIKGTNEELKQTPRRKSFTVAYRGSPGSIIGATVAIGILSLLIMVPGIVMLALFDYMIVPGIMMIIFGFILLITTIVYTSYFVHNKKNMPTNCIEYDGERDKLILCTLYGEIIEIEVEEYIELKDNFFTDNMLLFTYRTKDGSAKKVKLGYCANRDEIRANIRKIRE